MKRRRDLTELARAEGLEGVEVNETRGGHLLIRGAYRGRAVQVIASATPSCHRDRLNMRADIRRAINQGRSAHG